ncbi:D-alanyl-D-alanine carboxypeptidase (penicillin-binding protein 5/6) [Rhodococcus sp. AG1013]|uniref:D-alanyl-D-alanine carboxypeptidase family protein n=1 Tax=Rhodococcus sp. AG1013 TaxID=2183996 RepID=UPI000E0B4B6B|nr:D-alanyl-D-alanine carboxypeptidase family protein [Rhodococcus sp. AG1013]RDI16155.1 D-alanyl-D-alanine carboxypeptidase (penicillin-binding protein 5/6) [Rhodococcus sp. AG1013]
MTALDKTARRRLLLTATAATLAFGAGAAPAAALPAAAQQPLAADVDPSPTTTPPFSTPSTDSCPHRQSPPPAIDLSEVPRPGESAPAPVPVPDDPVGGDALGNCGIVTAPGTPPLPADLSATGWILSDLDTGQVLAAKDPHGRYRPASTIKILLSLVALDELDLDKTVVADATAAATEGSSVGLGAGGTYTNHQLMQGLVMRSGNDAAHALAAQLGGDEATVAKMNAKAQSLGALDTRTASVSGLDGPGMSTSPYDLALFFRAAMQNPTFAQLISTDEVMFPGHPADPTVPDSKPVEPYPIYNDNLLLANYAGALGGKTGYTDDARQTFVGGADRDGRRLAVTLMAADVLPIRPWEQAARLLDYGYALDPDTSVGALVDPMSATDGSAVAVAGPDSSDAGGMDLASGSDLPNKDVAGRVAVGIVGSGVIIGLLGWARALTRRRRR